MARLLYLVLGAATACWGLWGAGRGWTQWIWLAAAGVLLVLGLIGFSPLHAWFAKKNPKAI
jgi:glucose dehydrogenase